MGMAIMGLGGVVGLLAFVCYLVVLIGAFKKDTATGLLSLFIAPYALYFAFAKFDHQKKGLVLAGWLGGLVVCFALQAVGGAMAGAAAMESMPH